MLLQSITKMKLDTLKVCCIMNRFTTTGNLWANMLGTPDFVSLHYVYTDLAVQMQYLYNKVYLQKSCFFFLYFLCDFKF